ncbi:ComEC/Rec2 family competence protein [Deinococcus lacus]|uniref:ComEC/Rec2 family competence protein n=1 Tax=Deinococcus lacus TaxID=392561 RepID=A0ABW1YDT9_9DEIO
MGRRHLCPLSGAALGVVSAAGLTAYAVAALAGVAWLLGWVRPPLALGTLLACALLTAVPPLLRPVREVVFLDVGQGDATLVRTPELRLLIDGGGTPRGDYDVGRDVVAALRSMGVHSLDVVVATHADADHIEGLATVLRSMPVGELWAGHLNPDDPVLGAVLAAAGERGVPVRAVRRGDTVERGKLKVVVLWPPGNVWSTADNENSVALRLEAGEKRVGFLGDLPSPLEASLGLGQLDLLKAAHHGSRLSTGEPLLHETAPQAAVISVGRNTYGHPSPEVLLRLSEAGVQTWCTDVSGTLRWPLP